MTGKQISQIFQAFLSAFPRRGALQRLLLFHLEVDLETVAGGENYADLVFHVIQWAESSGRIDELLEAALAEAPANLLLRGCASTLARNSNPTLELPAPVPSLSPSVALSPPAALISPGGTMDAQSPLYLLREKYHELAMREISRPGATITIKGPGQVGKSSLAVRLLQEAERRQRRVVFLDFQQVVGNHSLENSHSFYQEFCTALSDALELDVSPDSFWSNKRSNQQACSLFLTHLLSDLDAPLTLAMDEVQRLLTAEFCGEFIGMLRGWHNRRAREPTWKRLDIIQVISTEPYLFTQDITQSAFNVGLVIELGDFSLQEVLQLNQLHGSPLQEAEVQTVFDLLEGHPFLTHVAVHTVAIGQMRFEELVDRAADDRGPFGDHLRRFLLLLQGKDHLVRGLLQIIQEKKRPDVDVLYRLCGSGLVREVGTGAAPRCALYARYLKERLNV